MAQNFATERVQGFTPHFDEEDKANIGKIKKKKLPQETEQQGKHNRSGAKRKKKRFRLNTRTVHLTYDQIHIPHDYAKQYLETKTKTSLLCFPMLSKIHMNSIKIKISILIHIYYKEEKRNLILMIKIISISYI